MKKLPLIMSGLLISLLSFAQAPDFSGKWSLDATKSKMSSEFSMAPGKITIEQKGNNLKMEKISNFQGEGFTTTEQYTLDGKESTNAGFMDSQRKSTANWSADKKALNIVSKIAFDGGEVNINETYKLDGNNLVVESSSKSSFGDTDETYVYTKE